MCLKKRNNKQCPHPVLPPMTWLTPLGKPFKKGYTSADPCNWCFRTIAVGRSCKCSPGLPYDQSHVLQQIMFYQMTLMLEKFGTSIYSYRWTRNMVDHMRNRARVWAHDPSFVKPLQEWLTVSDATTVTEDFPKDVSLYRMCIEEQLRAQAPKI
jgi:hypothetical protein